MDEQRSKALGGIFAEPVLYWRGDRGAQSDLLPRRQDAMPSTRVRMVVLSVASMWPIALRAMDQLRGRAAQLVMM